ncbi:universal stress protein [Desulforhopalus singaporensis]|uniref:Nucleotide-binding universal stress protein, UspA family n=1 Tax=Desulforhopalus singaporensis TaxID=91360 RepID=A0A1H0RNH4_9BACT|nr:universal stress protein [Desulforhopalus singaporensis]SDP30536.1 Nucleotide-binding universal stress protein, UspA family [Desulforhopalus singaporensis]
MSERILLPLDGSALGEAAIAYVDGLIARLAPEERIEITLFHVITAVRQTLHLQGGGMISVPYNEDELAKLKTDATTYLEKVGERLQHKQITLGVKVAVSENPAEEIIRAEAEVNADLVAMSTHGRSGVSRFALGSVAEKVLRGGTVPVLMVRAVAQESAA